MANVPRAEGATLTVALLGPRNLPPVDELSLDGLFEEKRRAQSYASLLAGDFLLLVIDHPAWPYYGLVGGGMHIYFAGRGLCTRIVLRRGGFRVGSARGLNTAYLFLILWGVTGLITTVAAVRALRGS